jgi:MFS family permease
VNRYRDLLREREFALLWGGATISALGDGMSFVALVWLLIERGGSPADVGWLAAVYTAPVIVGGIAAGIVLDRFDPRRVIAADNLIRGAAIASVPIAAAVGHLTTPHLFVVAAIYGLLFMTSIAGIPSLITRLVPTDKLTTANAMESITYGIAGLIGPAFAGVVIAAFSAPVVLAVDAATYLVFVACLLAMRREGGAVTTAAGATDEAHAETLATGTLATGTLATGTLATGTPAGGVPEAVAPMPIGAGIGPAVRFILGAPAIVATTAMYMCLNISGGIAIVVVPLYVRDVLGGGPATFGFLLSALTAGELVGLIAVGAIGWRWPLGRSIAGAALASGLILSLWLLRPPLLVLAVILAASGVTESSLTPWAQTIRMRLIPPPLRGRVFALLRTLMQSTRPIGSIAAGLLLVGADMTPALVAIALLVAVPGAVGLWLPALGRGPTAEPASTG